MPSLVLGTAGHIDHGKSALIKALTGTDPDRLAEEKERGITIELGFARLELPGGASMGVVDVPGHEKFVRQMVAGATGIDVVMLVIAADDGIMPQTREHLAIIDLLGISRGVVALTKADLVDPDWIEMVRDDVSGLLEGTSLEGAPIVAVSSKTGAGLDDLRGVLAAIAGEAPSRQAVLPLRLPVDRVFTIAGAGTVVTGTLWSGSAARDDEIELYPSRNTGRIRGVQVHGEKVEKAGPGHRVALNIAGLDRDEIQRGDIVAAPGTLAVTDRFDARFTYLGFPGDDKSFESGTRVHVHHGTREVLGRVLLMGAAELAPGQTSLAQLRLEESIAPRYEDRFIVRSYSPTYTIGGGVVLDVLPPRRTTLKPHERELLEALIAHDLAGAALGLLRARAVPMTSADVANAIGVTRPQVADDLNKADLQRIKLGSETYFVTAEAITDILECAERTLVQFHETNPAATGVAAAALRDKVDKRLDLRLFDAMLQDADWAVIEGGQIRHAKAAVSALAEEEKAVAAIRPMLAAQGLAPESVMDLAAAARVDVNVARKVLGKLALDREVVRLGSELHFDAAAIAGARSALVAYLTANGSGTAAQLRDALGVSRKYAIPLLEYFDAQGVTRREGDVRVLRQG
ncbi:MAG: selenocysteine-specific translation elongation factor [Actinobacteria bacterium HGW-Actinobacteria-10]|jgi:selenocysteine-specific elongation factor|nr:MAG: selenocysteine-specific translation elongation factor [Actinobacteria bacterium HGW-Actinobacteria-10]